MTQQELDALAASAARNSLLAYAIGHVPSYECPPHLELLTSKLEAVMDGRIKRLMVFMPPRHGKSNLASEIFPAWYLGHRPHHQVMFTTYGQDLADGFGRKVRNAVGDARHVRAFPESVLADDSKSAQRFNTTAGGVYYAVGAGGAVTGRGADLLLIDDPMKNREEADSRLMRDKLWDWYASTAYTRLMPGGAVCLIQCMTGDTPVMLEDGSERPLREVRVGDRIATYRDGALSVAAVTNWASNGLDSVFAIKTISGRIVRANGRHPFLVNEAGELKWVRTKDLRPGQKMLRVNGESGRVKPANGKAATSPWFAGGIAHRTTTRSDGLTEFARRLLTKSLAALRTSNTATASLLMSTTGCWRLKAVSAPSAGGRPVTTCEPTGVESSASITATTPKKSALSYATTAIWSWATQRLLRLLRPQRDTSDFTLDEIAEIVADGVEEVFDVEVAETENFIANGLVSHNTRWHEDDLAGRLLNGDEHWEVVNLPAIAEPGDMLGRQEGVPLWPERYGLDDLNRIRSTIGEREFIALYQQRPSPLEGALFRRDWIARGKAPRSGTRVAMGVDLALSTKTSADYTAIVIMARDEFGKLYVLDAVRERVDFPGALRLIRLMADKWNPKAIAIEQVAYQAVVVQELLRQTTLPIKGVTPDKDKVTRAQPLALRYEQGLVYHEDLPSWFEDELLSFPQGLHDDAVDAAVYAYQSVMSMARSGDTTGYVESFNALDVELGI